FRAALAIHHRKPGLRQFEAFGGQRQKMLALDPHRLADRVRLPGNPPLFVLLAACAQILVQLTEVLHSRHRYQMVPPEVARFAFHAALLVATRRVTELRLETPVRTERDQPVGLLALMPAQNLLHRAFQVVVVMWRGALCVRTPRDARQDWCPPR